MENFLESRLKAKGHRVDFFKRGGCWKGAENHEIEQLHKAWGTREAFSDGACN